MAGRQALRTGARVQYEAMIGRMGILLWLVLSSAQPARAADAGFAQFIASLWPEAQAAGVSRATFDAETRGLEPDYKLPDLILPGRPATGAPSQAEFVQVPADYIKEASIIRLAQLRPLIGISLICSLSIKPPTSAELRLR